MANKASADRVSADIRPPNFRAAVQLMRHDIKKKKDRMSGIQGEINDSWGKIEGHGVDKIGAKIFMKLDALEPDERVAAFRTINGLADVAEWAEDAEDLVDKAEGNVVHMRVPGEAKGAGEDGKAAAPATTPAAAKGSGRAAALSSAKKHLNPDAPPESDGTMHE